MGKTYRSTRKRDDVAQTVADITGFTPRHVNMVRDGLRENEVIELVTVEYTLGRNNLIKHLQKLVPLSLPTSRYGRKKN